MKHPILGMLAKVTYTLNFSIIPETSIFWSQERPGTQQCALCCLQCCALARSTPLISYSFKKHTFHFKRPHHLLKKIMIEIFTKDKLISRQPPLRFLKY